MRRRNSLDEELRRLERLAAIGDTDAERRLVAMRERSGRGLSAEIDEALKLNDNMYALAKLAALHGARVWEILEKEKGRPTLAEAIEARQGLLDWAREHPSQVVQTRYHPYGDGPGWEDPSGFNDLDHGYSEHSFDEELASGEIMNDEGIVYLYVMPNDLSGGDYAGSGSISFSNHRSFIRDYGEVPGVFDLGGGHGSFGVAIRLDAANKALVEALEGLDNYPILDEDDFSQREMEEEEEAWESWVHHDFKKELEARFGCDLDNVPDLYPLFHDLMERANENWEHDSSGAGVNVARLTREATRGEVLALGCATEESALDQERRDVANDALEDFARGLELERRKHPTREYSYFHLPSLNDAWTIKGNVWSKVERFQGYGQPKDYRRRTFKVTFKTGSAKLARRPSWR